MKSGYRDFRQLASDLYRECVERTREQTGMVFSVDTKTTDFIKSTIREQIDLLSQFGNPEVKEALAGNRVLLLQAIAAEGPVSDMPNLAFSELTKPWQFSANLYGSFAKNLLEMIEERATLIAKFRAPFESGHDFSLN